MNILNRLKVSMKLALVLGVSALSLVVALGVAASFQRQHMMEERIALLRAVVETAHGYAESLESQVTAGKLTHDAALDQFRAAIHAMWYDGHRDYLLMYTMDGVSIVNAADPTQEGSNRLAAKDVNGKPIVGSMIDALRDKTEATTSYVYPKPGQTAPLPKVTFVSASSRGTR
jgi:methyl-accepting chemotaxis protein